MDTLGSLRSLLPSLDPPFGFFLFGGPKMDRMAPSDQDTKMAIGPGFTGLSLRSPCACLVTCHPSPEDLEDILKEGRRIKRCRKIEQGDLFI